MNDNDILIARKTEGGHRTVVLDGDAADCERVNRQVQERQKAEADKAQADAARKKQHDDYLTRLNAAKKAKADAEAAKRRKRVQLTGGMVLSIGALMALTLLGLMHTVVGMVFLAGDAAAFGWLIGREC